MKLPAVGTKILRNVTLKQSDTIAKDYVKSLDNTPFPPETDGSYCFRVWRDNKVASGYYVALPRKTIGVVCFCPGKIPHDFTHFNVLKHTRNSNALIVQAIVGDVDELLDYYKTPKEIDDYLLREIRILDDADFLDLLFERFQYANIEECIDTAHVVQTISMDLHKAGLLLLNIDGTEKIRKKVEDLRSEIMGLL